MGTIRIFGLFYASLSVLALPAVAQTADETTPANEGVCDVLLGATPGLYGLCVAFSEAQDCEATYDQSTGEITLDPSCSPSSQKLLDLYNKRKGPSDPLMPGVNVVVGGCPCWTEEEIGTVGSDRSVYEGCRKSATNTVLVSSGTEEVGLRDMALVSSSTAGITCRYENATMNDPDNYQRIIRYQNITVDQFLTCEQSILDECAARGIPVVVD